MRIKIIGDNDCARATRNLLRQAGFAVSEHQPADAVIRGPHAGYAITIELAAKSESVSPTLAPPPETSFAPGLSPQHKPAARLEGTSAAAPPAADASSPAYASGAAAKGIASDTSQETPQRDSSSSPQLHAPLSAGQLHAPLTATRDGSSRNDTSGNGGPVIHLDSVESALETAVLRHVAQLWAYPVVVDRPGGRARHERELRILLPVTANDHGGTQQNDAAAKAIEFGVLRAMLDLSSPNHSPTSTSSSNAGKAAPETSQAPSATGGSNTQTANIAPLPNTAPNTGTTDLPPAKKRKWWMLFAIFLLAPFARIAHSEPAPAPAPAPAPTAAQVAAWRLAFAFPQGQQSTGAIFDSVYDSGNTALKVNCVVGCSATSGFSDNSAFTVGGTVINPIGALYSTSTPAVSSGNAGRLRMDSNSYLYVDCATGCSGSGGGSSSNFGSAFPAAGTPIGATNGTDMEPLQVNGSGYLETLIENSSIAVTGTFWQSTQPVSLSFLPAFAATPTFNCGTGCYQATQPVSLTGSWPYSGALGTVSLTGTLPGFASTPTVNAAESGTWSVTATQSTGSNLHVDVDSAPTTTVTGTVTANQGGSNWTVSCSAAANCPVQGALGDNGAAATTNRVGVLAGIAESNVPSAETAGRDAAIATNLQRQAIVSQMPEDSFASYEAAATVASASSATDIAVISGNATNTVMVTRVVVSCTQTTAGIISLYLVKRSSADSGGTSSSLTAVPMDSNFSSASSAAKTYTANPTTGSAVGNVDVANMGCMAASTASPNDVYVLNLWQKPIVLRGTAQQLAVNLNGASVSGGSFAVRFEWIETSNL